MGVIWTTQVVSVSGTQNDNFRYVDCQLPCKGYCNGFMSCCCIRLLYAEHIQPKRDSARQNRKPTKTRATWKDYQVIFYNDQVRNIIFTSKLFETKILFTRTFLEPPCMRWLALFHFLIWCSMTGLWTWYTHMYAETVGGATPNATDYKVRVRVIFTSRKSDI